ncbi:MAG: hypothetical protein ACW98I_18825 [Candidatus Hodarchaeales archaeon]
MLNHLYGSLRKIGLLAKISLRQSKISIFFILFLFLGSSLSISLAIQQPAVISPIENLRDTYGDVIYDLEMDDNAPQSYYYFTIFLDNLMENMESFEVEQSSYVWRLPIWVNYTGIIKEKQLLVYSDELFHSLLEIDMNNNILSAFNNSKNLIETNFVFNSFAFKSTNISNINDTIEIILNGNSNGTMSLQFTNYIQMTLQLSQLIDGPILTSESQEIGKPQINRGEVIGAISSNQFLDLLTTSNHTDLKMVEYIQSQNFIRSATWITNQKYIFLSDIKSTIETSALEIQKYFQIFGIKTDLFYMITSISSEQELKFWNTILIAMVLDFPILLSLLHFTKLLARSEAWMNSIRRLKTQEISSSVLITIDFVISCVTLSLSFIFSSLVSSFIIIPIISNNPSISLDLEFLYSPFSLITIFYCTIGMGLIFIVGWVRPRILTILSLPKSHELRIHSIVNEWDETMTNPFKERELLFELFFLLGALIIGELFVLNNEIKSGLVSSTFFHIIPTSLIIIWLIIESAVFILTYLFGNGLVTRILRIILKSSLIHNKKSIFVFRKSYTVYRKNYRVIIGYFCFISLISVFIFGAYDLTNKETLYLSKLDVGTDSILTFNGNDFSKSEYYQIRKSLENESRILSISLVGIGEIYLETQDIWINSIFFNPTSILPSSYLSLSPPRLISQEIGAITEMNRSSNQILVSKLLYSQLGEIFQNSIPFIEVTSDVTWSIVGQSQYFPSEGDISKRSLLIVPWNLIQNTSILTQVSSFNILIKLKNPEEAIQIVDDNLSSISEDPERFSFQTLDSQVALHLKSSHLSLLMKNKDVWFFIPIYYISALLIIISFVILIDNRVIYEMTIFRVLGDTEGNTSKKILVYYFLPILIITLISGLILILCFLILFIFSYNIQYLQKNQHLINYMLGLIFIYFSFIIFIFGGLYGKFIMVSKKIRNKQISEFLERN